MPLREFLEKLEQKDGDLLYLSTQESTNEDKFQVPCKELLEQHFIEKSVPWAGNLILHSCNLVISPVCLCVCIIDYATCSHVCSPCAQWMGKSQDGSSSGLHHDYHDNFYLLMRGSKRFRVFSPDCAPFMYTHGDIDKIHFNGRISYRGKETRADGVPLGMTKAVEDESDDDEDEVVLGKGFDYKSDSESGDGFGGKDDFDEIVGTNDPDNNGQESLDDEGTDRDETARPDSFSKINVETIENKTVLVRDFPLFSSCRELIIDLKEGQTLYLPTGWFHEVRSTGGQNHTALNYWYHPPDSLDNFKRPYQDLFWAE